MKDTNIDTQAVMQALQTMMPELGYFAACTAVLQEMRYRNKDRLEAFFQLNGRNIPVLEALAKNVFEGNAEAYIKAILEKMSPVVTKKSRVLLIGCETAILDLMVRQFPQIQFHVILHSSDANLLRIEANYCERKVTIHETFEVSSICGTDCMLLAFGYGVSRNRFFTYPIFHRIVGHDSRQEFARLGLVGLSNEQFRHHPFELTEVNSDVMTDIFLP